jgi:hypothetical protein
MSFLLNMSGILGVVVMAAGLAALILRWHVTEVWWFRPALILFGALCAAIVILSIRRKYDLVAYSYVFLMALLTLWQLMEGLTRLAQAEPREPEPQVLSDSLRRARILERRHNYIGAVQAYDLHLEANPADVAARVRMAEALVRSSNAKRAIAVLTVAYAQSQDPRERIRIGVRLAELLLVARRDPLGARAQLEQVRAEYAGTENEGYAEDIAETMLKRAEKGGYRRR